MLTPSLEEARVYAKEYNTVPIFITIGRGVRTPTEVFRALKNLSRQCFILESLEDKRAKGRYTFLGYDPKLEITCADGCLTIKNGTTLRLDGADPREHIKRIVEENKSPAVPGAPPFAGGLVGYFSYDYIKYAEPTLNLNAEDNENFKDVDIMLFDKIVAYDNLNEELTLIVNIKTDSLEENYNMAASELEHMKNIVTKGDMADMEPLKITSRFRELFSKEKFCDMVEKAKEYIRAGDIFQAVLSNRLDADAEGGLFDTYRILRETNPSPYMFYFSGDDIEIAGASPETLVKITDGYVYAFPLAGTYPRGLTPEEDEELEKKLLSDPKELAEHNMLVDLGRNDIGKISEFSSVNVEQYLSIERFSHVMHIGSTVKGKLKKGLTATDAIDAVLPAGTLSGAPKIRACEIINELENNKRGIYGGALGYISFSGSVDMCIAIRIAFKKNGKVFARSGAGIVADSVAEKEFLECAAKAKAVVDALKRGGFANDTANRQL